MSGVAFKITADSIREFGPLWQEDFKTTSEFVKTQTMSLTCNDEGKREYTVVGSASLTTLQEKLAFFFEASKSFKWWKPAFKNIKPSMEDELLTLSPICNDEGHEILTKLCEILESRSMGLSFDRTNYKFTILGSSQLDEASLQEVCKVASIRILNTNDPDGNRRIEPVCVRMTNHTRGGGMGSMGGPESYIW